MKNYKIKTRIWITILSIALLISIIINILLHSAVLHLIDTTVFDQDILKKAYEGHYYVDTWCDSVSYRLSK